MCSGSLLEPGVEMSVNFFYVKIHEELCVSVVLLHSVK